MPNETRPILPGHGQQANLLELLFERMPMGVAILDRQYRIQRYNPTWGDFAVRYAPLTGVPLAPGVGYFDHLPGSEAFILPLFERVLTGETIQANSVRLESGGIVTYWDIVLAPLAENAEVVGILNVAVDVTEQVQLRQTLEQRVEARTQELQVLLDVSATASRSLNLTELLQKTLDRVVSLVQKLKFEFKFKFEIQMKAKLLLEFVFFCVYNIFDFADLLGGWRNYKIIIFMGAMIQR